MVHCHPPINSLGSNTCLSDAFNVAWKIAYVLKGIANTKLLESLSIERKSVGDAIVRRANTGMEAHRTLWSVIGLTPEERQKACALLEEDSYAGCQKREAWTNALEAIDAEIQALGTQMNQVYLNSPAVVAEPDDSAPDFGSLDPIMELKISTYPEYHLPCGLPNMARVLGNPPLTSQEKAHSHCSRALVAIAGSRVKKP